MPEAGVTAHGGKRPGSGRPAGAKAEHYIELNRAKARKEVMRAGLLEAQLMKVRGELYERAEVRQTVARVIAVFAETVRGAPDAIERRYGVDPEVCEFLTEYLDTALDEARDKLAKAG